MATVKRDDAKRMLRRLLMRQGYVTYSNLLGHFNIFLTDDPDTIGYMIPGKNIIVLNGSLRKEQVSVIVRHEILHEYLRHAAREEKWLSEHPDRIPDRELSNIAADFEISNRAYTDADKLEIKKIILGNKVLKGLVTEMDEPGWENLTFEEMLEELLEDAAKYKDKLQHAINMSRHMSPPQNSNNQNSPQNPANSEPVEEGEPGMTSSSGGGNPGATSPAGGSNQYPTQSGSGGIGEDDNTESSDGPENSGKTGRGNKSDNQDQSDSKDGKASGKGRNEGEIGDSDSINDGSASNGDGTEGTSDDVAKAAAESDVDDISHYIDSAEDVSKYFSDPDIMDKLIKETEAPVKRERADKLAKAEAEYRNNPLRKFKLSLNRFIADQIGLNREETWTRLNPSYEDSEFLIPGVARQEVVNTPLINVYHDVSASFKDEAKTAAAMSAIASLNELKRKGKIAIEYYYFAVECSKNKSKEMGNSWDTRGVPVLNNIKQTKPTNVIIITDSDIDDCYEEVKVPGAVWMLFYGSKSQNLIDHLKGKKQTKAFMIGG